MRRLALLGIGLGLVLSLAACADEDGVPDAAPAQHGDARGAGDEGPEALANPTAGRTGPLPDGGAASCVETYAPRAVARRAFAFDGVVLEIGPSVSDRADEADLGLPGVRFAVREWFTGGRADTVTVDLQPPTTGSADPSDPGYVYGVGSRLLVSGEARWGGSPLEAPIGWGCGFSRYYDPRTAAAWREALAR